MWRRYTFDKLSKFWSCVTSNGDAESLGHPMARKINENVNQAEELVLRNRRITIHEVVNMLGIAFGSVQSILKDNVNTCPNVAKWLLCLLSEKQDHCVNTCQDLLEASKRPGIPFGDNHRWRDVGLQVQSRNQACHISGRLLSTPCPICIKIIICKPALIYWHLTVPVDKCTMKRPKKQNLCDRFLHYDEAYAHSALSMLKT